MSLSASSLFGVGKHEKAKRRHLAVEGAELGGVLNRSGDLGECGALVRVCAGKRENRRRGGGRRVKTCLWFS